MNDRLVLFMNFKGPTKSLHPTMMLLSDIANDRHFNRPKLLQTMAFKFIFPNGQKNVCLRSHMARRNWFSHMSDDLVNIRMT